jgi:hypothetical protein
MVFHTYNPSTREAEAGGLQVQGHLVLHIETLPQKAKQNRELFKLSKLFSHVSLIDYGFTLGNMML